MIEASKKPRRVHGDGAIETRPTKTGSYRIARRRVGTILGELPSLAIRVDAKGRLTVPRDIRTRLEIKPGDTMFLRRTGKVLAFVKAEDPFVALAKHAIEEANEGRTKSLEQYAMERGIDLNDHDV